MQSVCVLLTPQYASRTVDARAALCEDPSIGALYDPPFAHFTLQLAEEYDWSGLEAALATFVKQWQPFELQTVGLLAFTGANTGITIAPRKDRKLLEFQAAVWETITPFAEGRVDQFYHPDNWVPHITIKRTGTNASGFGNAMARLASDDFKWTTQVTNVSVQHDPGKNSQTHYLRSRFLLAGASWDGEPLPAAANATILGVDETTGADGAPLWVAKVACDDGRTIDVRWDAPTRARIMADAKSSAVHFAGARCRLDGDAISAVVPNTPFPVP
jgi:2'-5' RNA ligase